MTGSDQQGVREDTAPRRGRLAGEVGARGGSALVVAVWVVALLSLMVGSFAFEAHMEANIISYYRKRTKAERLAMSGIPIAEMLMKKREEAEKAGDEADEEDRWHESAKRLADGLALSGSRAVTESLGDGTIRVEIVPEPARRNVNSLKNEEEWEGILEVGGIPEDYWPELAESFFDWTDDDETARTDGGETDDYYSSLEPPYAARNGPVDTVGELLLVKGFKPAILYGGVLEEEEDTDGEPLAISGIEDLLTTYGDGKVNVNAAGRRVLMTLPGVDELVANAIIEEREGWLDEEGESEDTSFDNVADLFARIPELDSAVRKYVTTDSTIYRITCVGTVHGVSRKIWCIAQFSGGEMTILRWREQG